MIILSVRQQVLPRTRTVDAIQQLDRSGTPVNFTVVAAQAGVSRSWLYRQADLRAQIEALRTDPRHSHPVLPQAIRASHESVRAQRDALQTAIDRLNQEKQQLTAQIERLLGERRATHTTPRHQL